MHDDEQDNMSEYAPYLTSLVPYLVGFFVMVPLVMWLGRSCSHILP
ncbi:hypothetical protein FHW17_002690 [Phyllobacterium sp. P30BS-XVII]|jgi:hypothetical protein|nr:hypothetical protein [Phyllobacterium sp. P30BS-XVII]SDP49159.1 hypothetical protein SAMN05443582_105151 [Phyllobacterium sp. OV277]